MNIFDTQIQIPKQPKIDTTLQIKQAPEPTIMGSKFLGKINEGLKKITEPIQELFRPYSVKTEKESLANAINEQSLIDASFNLAIKRKNGYQLNKEETSLMEKGMEAFSKRSMDLALGFLTPEMKVVKPITDDIVKVATNKLVQAIKEAKPLRAKAEKLYTAERSVRAGLGTEAMATGGEQGYFGALSKLKGELPKPKFEGVRATEEFASPLYTEARKYKTAEEYVKGNDLVFQGGVKGTQSEWWTTNIDVAREFATRYGKIDKSLGEIRVAKFSDLPPEFRTAIDKYGNSVMGDKPLTKIEYQRLQADRSNVITIPKGKVKIIDYLHPDSQLTDIWEKANKGMAEQVNKLTQQEVDTLFTQIQQSPKLDFFNKITAQTGLSKILGEQSGSIPTEGELKLLQGIFGEDLIKAVLSKRSFGEKFWENVSETLNVPRALVSSFDMSAPLRQGLVLTTSHPVKATGAGIDMVKSFFNPKAYDALMENIANRQSFKLMQDSKLALTDITGDAIYLSAKEEAFMTNFAEKIPILGKVVKASERAYAGFLNKIRADVFDDLASRYIEKGITPNDNPEFYTFLAEFINNASGRGNLGKTLDKASHLLNSVFFSPKLIMSRFNMLNPAWYFKLPTPIRKEAAKSFVKMVGTGISVLSLAKMGGADVELNPTSSDFGKIKVGNTRWDVWGGFQQWVRLTAQIIMNQSKSTSGNITKFGEGYKPTTSLDKLGDFFMGKLAPTPALVADILREQNMIGEKVNVSDKVIPFYIKDLIEAYNELGGFAIPSVGIPGFFGVGTQTFKQKKKNIFD